MALVLAPKRGEQAGGSGGWLLLRSSKCTCCHNANENDDPRIVAQQLAARRKAGLTCEWRWLGLRRRLKKHTIDVLTRLRPARRQTAILYQKKTRKVTDLMFFRLYSQ